MDPENDPRETLVVTTQDAVVLNAAVAIEMNDAIIPLPERGETLSAFVSDDIAITDARG